MANIGYGWSESEACSLTDGKLVFIDEGFVVNESTHLKSENNVVINSSFVYKSVDNGLILWYNDKGYIKYILSPNGLSLIRLYEGNEISLRNLMFDTHQDITAPEENAVVDLRVELYLTNIKCYYNDVPVLNIEQSAFKEGAFGIYGENGTICNSFSVESNPVRDWLYEKKEGCGITSSDGVVKFSNGNTDYSCLYQEIPTAIGETYEVSMEYSGSVYVKAEDGTQIIADKRVTGQGRLSFTFDAVSEVTLIAFGTDTVGVLEVTKPQVENKTFATSYTDEVRENAVLSFPANRMDRYEGGFSCWMSASHGYESGVLPIFYYNDSLRLEYTGGSFVFTYGTSQTIMPYVIEANVWYHIICTWVNGNSISINIYDDVSDAFGDSIVGNEEIPLSDRIYIGSTPEIAGNIVADTIAVYIGEVTTDKMKDFRAEPIPEDSRLAVKTNFDNETLVYSKERITLPNPKPCTPILVEDSDGTPYERVYFVDNGKYVTYTGKKFKCNSNSFQLDWDDVIKVSVFGATQIYDDISVEQGMVTVNGLNENEEEITVVYTPKNAFCANYNKATNGYEMEFGNVNGLEVLITYENIYGAISNLIRTIETNPFKSANNNGFVYVTAEPVNTVSLDVKVTPEAIVADGHQIVTVTVDCVGSNGTNTGNADIEIKGLGWNEKEEKYNLLRYGAIEKYVSEEERAFLEAYEQEKALYGEEAAIEKYGNFITDEHRSGRYIYKYKVHNISKPGIYTEKIVFNEAKTGIGTEATITITSKS